MRNLYIPRLKNATVDNFTSDFGIKARRFISPQVHALMKYILERKVKTHVFNYPELEKDTAYIFASTHSFPDDIISALVNIDRHAYFLTNSVDQVNHNPEMYAAWVNGFIFVNTRDKKSTSASLPKMQRVLDNNSSILIYPEASWNISENKIVNKLFPGTAILAHRANKKVVPLGSFHEHGSKDIYLNFGKPMDFTDLSVEDATLELRDELSALRFELIENYSTPCLRHQKDIDPSKPLRRNALSDTPRQDWVDLQVQIVEQFKWFEPDWEDEYLTYKDKSITEEADVWNFVRSLDYNERDEKIEKLIASKNYLEAQRTYETTQFFRNINEQFQAEDDLNVVKVLQKRYKTR